MKIQVMMPDNILSRYSAKVSRLSDGEARRAFAAAVNHEGDKGRTQVKRALVRQTGVKYNSIEQGMRTLRAHPNSLAYQLEQSGNETNISEFGAKATGKGVSASPWNKRRVFTSSFRVEKAGGKVFLRIGKSRYPIKQIYGPNIAREIIKDESGETWESTGSQLSDRVGHELNRILSKL